MNFMQNSFIGHKFCCHGHKGCPKYKSVSGSNPPSIYLLNDTGSQGVGRGPNPSTVKHAGKGSCQIGRLKQGVSQFSK